MVTNAFVYQRIAEIRQTGVGMAWQVSSGNTIQRSRGETYGGAGTAVIAPKLKSAQLFNQKTEDQDRQPPFPQQMTGTWPRQVRGRPA